MTTARGREAPDKRADRNGADEAQHRWHGRNGRGAHGATHRRNDDADQLSINAEYAQQYEARKRREELHQLCNQGYAVHGRPDNVKSRSAKLRFGDDDAGGEDGDEDEESDEDGDDEDDEDEFAEQLTKRVDAQWRDALLAIQSKDPRIYDRNYSFYADQSEQHTTGNGKAAERGRKRGRNAGVSANSNDGTGNREDEDNANDDEGGDDDDGDDDDGDDDGDDNDDDEPVAGYETLAQNAEREASMLMKDYVRERILRDGALDVDNDDDDNDDNDNARNGTDPRSWVSDAAGGAHSEATLSARDSVPAYDAEQAELKRDLIAQGNASVADASRSSGGGGRSGRAAATGDAHKHANDDGDGGGDDDELFRVKHRDRTSGAVDAVMAENAHNADGEHGDSAGAQTRASSAHAAGSAAVAARDASAHSARSRRVPTSGHDVLRHAYLDTETTDEKEAFLRDFVLNNGWLDRTAVAGSGVGASASSSSSGVPRSRVEARAEQVVATDSDEQPARDAADEDERFIERQEQFEHSYNFRFEEPDAAHIASHPRVIDDSLRRSKSDARQRQRAARVERKAQERAHKEEQIKRAKNLKRAELEERMRALATASGIRDEATLTALAAGGGGGGGGGSGEPDDDAFNPAEHDRLMHEQFGAAYDAAAENDDAWQHANDGDAGDGDGDGDGGARTRHWAGPNSGNQGDIGDLDALDYEDVTAGTRFQYRRVDPLGFGLSATDILNMDERDLNAYASIKYTRPFHPLESMPRRIRKLARGNVGMKRHRMQMAHGPSRGHGSGGSGGDDADAGDNGAHGARDRPRDDNARGRDRRRDDEQQQQQQRRRRRQQRRQQGETSQRQEWQQQQQQQQPSSRQERRRGSGRDDADRDARDRAFQV